MKSCGRVFSGANRLQDGRELRRRNDIHQEAGRAKMKRKRRDGRMCPDSSFSSFRFSSP